MCILILGLTIMFPAVSLIWRIQNAKVISPIDLEPLAWPCDWNKKGFSLIRQRNYPTAIGNLTAIGDQPRPQGFSLKPIFLREKPWGRGW